MENKRPKKQWFLKVLSKDCWPYLYWVGLWAFVKVSKLLWSSSPICEALPSPLLLFVRHMARVCIPCPYPKCHNVELVVILCPNLVNFSLHQQIDYNYEVSMVLKVWSELWLINETLYIYVFDWWTASEVTAMCYDCYLNDL